VFVDETLIYMLSEYEYTRPFNITTVLLIDGELSSINNNIMMSHEEQGTYWRADPLYNKQGLPPGYYTYIILINDYEKAKVNFEIFSQS
jgi:hypothetical protein